MSLLRLDNQKIVVSILGILCFVWLSLEKHSCHVMLQTYTEAHRSKLEVNFPPGKLPDGTAALSNSMTAVS